MICGHCGDVIGVYEPLVVLLEGEARETSRAADPQLAAERGEHYHRDCYSSRQAGASLGA
jgi:hypothetical protein